MYHVPITPMTIDEQIRFWAKVDRKSKDECWPWIAGKTGDYGVIRFNNQNYVAHRISYYLSNLKDPGILLVCHTCNNKLCMNPDHFYLGTSQENIQQAYDDDLCNRKGELHPQAKFTEEKILSIRKAVANGVLQTVLAKQHHTSTGTINNIVKRRAWKHI